MKKVIILVLYTFIFCILGNCSNIPAGSREVRGSIRYKDTGRPAEGEILAIPITGQNGLKFQAYATGEDGKYVLYLPRGAYRIRINVPNYQSREFRLNRNDKWTRYNISLIPLNMRPPQQDLSAIILFLSKINIQFDFMQYRIKEKYIPVLNQIVTRLKQNPSLSIEIRGHTDKVTNPIYKKRNERISKMRAANVLRYLIERGIPKERLKIKSFGSNAPLAPNDTEENRARNRRVDLRVIQ